MLKSVVASRAVSVEPVTSGVRLGVVCPMANERDTAAGFVREVLAACEPFRFKSLTFFAVLDRVSRDGTLDLLRGLEAAVPQLRVVWAPENRCVVDAYLRGYREALDAGCDWVLEIDAGFSHQPSDIPRFFEKMSEGFDCVFGTRFAHGGGFTESPLKRKVISRGGTLLTNLLLGTKLTDMTSGFELFTRGALEHVLDRGINSRGHFFQTEIKAHCHGLRVAEVPIHYRAASDSVNNHVLKDAFSNLWRLFRARFNRGRAVAPLEQDEAA
ncbi:MAG TPA: glycosyltransferase [Pyrinomonadaceae bacterium]|nr:glycosyltransferase [Pyrinomonadaceae bacterium]